MLPLISMATVKLGNLFDVRIEFNELVCNIYQTWTGIGAKPCQFNAHAWVRWSGQILGDLPEHVATFTEVDDIRVLGRS